MEQACGIIFLYMYSMVPAIYQDVIIYISHLVDPTENPAEGQPDYFSPKKISILFKE